jgi:hypothetical protein
MTALQRIQQISVGIVKYGALAFAAVAQVQAEVGASSGDPAVQADKKQLAVLYVVAAAHAGESVPNATVQAISSVVELVAQMAKALGLFGKTPTPGAAVAVPAVSPIAPKA